MAKAPQHRSPKSIMRMIGAGVVSVGMVGVFAFPAYAVPVTEGEPDGLAFAQALTAEEAEIGTHTDTPAVELEAVEVVPVEETDAEAAPAVASYASDVPAGVGAQGLVNAALAQLGTPQDCTDLVQNSLAAIGLTSRRDAGGPNLGVNSFRSFGYQVTSGEYAPGDILLWPGNPHAAIYIGNGQAVHGGWSGSTRIAGAWAAGANPIVIRVG